MTFKTDFIERAVRTFIAAALTAVAASFSGVADITSGKAVALAGVTAGFSAVLSLIAKNFGDPESASFLVGRDSDG